MLSTRALLHFAAYSASLPSATIIPSKLVKETVYMPSAEAARMLGKEEPEERKEESVGGDG